MKKRKIPKVGDIIYHGVNKFRISEVKIATNPITGEMKIDTKQVIIL